MPPCSRSFLFLRAQGAAQSITKVTHVAAIGLGGSV